MKVKDLCFDDVSIAIWKNELESDYLDKNIQQKGVCILIKKKMRNQKCGRV